MAEDDNPSTIHQPFTNPSPLFFIFLYSFHSIYSLIIIIIINKNKKVKGGEGLKGCFPFSYQKMKKKMELGENVIFSPKNPKNLFFLCFIADLKTTFHLSPPHPKIENFPKKKLIKQNY